MQRPQTSVSAGVAFSLASYLLWGALPIYLVLLAPAGPYEIVAWRVVFSLALCAILIAVVRGWRRMAVLWRDRRVVGWLGLGAVLLTVNWTTFVYATSSGQVIEAALGYFLNPIITVLLGVIFLGERLRPLQWAAIVIAAIAVVVLIVAQGSVPWIGLLVAFSFGFYGLVKNRVGGRVDAISGLTIETVLLLPFAVLVLCLIAGGNQLLAAGSGGLVFGTLGPWHTFLMTMLGVATAVPLILFAAGARRAPLSYIGLTQFVAPILQFITGVVFLGEAMPAARWIGFAIVWLAVLLIAVDFVAQIARRPRSGS